VERGLVGCGKAASHVKRVKGEAPRIEVLLKPPFKRREGKALQAPLGRHCVKLLSPLNAVKLVL